MWIAPALAGLPDFWGIAVAAGVLVLLVTQQAAAVTGTSSRHVGGFATIVFWWIATGLDGWAEGGGGVGNSVPALGNPETAGSGAFGGVLSTPVEWVFASCLGSLLCGILLGLACAQLASLFATAETAPNSTEERAAPLRDSGASAWMSAPASTHRL